MTLGLTQVLRLRMRPLDHEQRVNQHHAREHLQIMIVTDNSLMTTLWTYHA